MNAAEPIIYRRKGERSGPDRRGFRLSFDAISPYEHAFVTEEGDDIPDMSCWNMGRQSPGA